MVELIHSAVNLLWHQCKQHVLPPFQRERTVAFRPPTRGGWLCKIILILYKLSKKSTIGEVLIFGFEKPYFRFYLYCMVGVQLRSILIGMKKRGIENIFYIT
jgi:hypothetical protein